MVSPTHRHSAKKNIKTVKKIHTFFDHYLHYFYGTDLSLFLPLLVLFLIFKIYLRLPQYDRIEHLTLPFRIFLEATAYFQGSRTRSDYISIGPYIFRVLKKNSWYLLPCDGRILDRHLVQFPTDMAIVKTLAGVFLYCTSTLPVGSYLILVTMTSILQCWFCN